MSAASFLELPSPKPSNVAGVDVEDVVVRLLLDDIADGREDKPNVRVGPADND